MVMINMRKSMAVSGIFGLALLGVIGMGFAPSHAETHETARFEARQAIDSFEIDPVHSTVLFRITHAGAGVFWGRFSKVSGTFAIDADDLPGSYFKVTVPISGVDTNNAKRDAHLSSGDFFNARQYPEATFESTSVVATDENGVFEVTGDLTLFGQTKSITARVLDNGKSRFQGKATHGFEVDFTVKRSEFGNTTYLAPDGSNSGLLGNDVRIIVAGEGREQ
jgi:polyisoprenoid-binding protein YceI